MKFRIDIGDLYIKSNSFINLGISKLLNCLIKFSYKPHAFQKIKLALSS